MSTLFISPARTRQVIAAIAAFALVSVFVIRTSDLADLPTSTGWTPEASPETQAFHFRVTVGPDAPQGRTAAGINLTWSVSTDTDG